MATQEVKRKLAAILSADVKGYSRLMGADEEGTLRILTAYREIMAMLIQQHHGRVVNAPGDALLAEFESVVDAVKSAAEIQRELAKRNADLPTDRRMEYRMGINLGDVMVDGESIYGDGVNIAARMESLADGGGICISGTTFDQVKNKLNLGYKYLGEQTVKNISEPVRVYRVLMEPEAVGKVIGGKKVKPTRLNRPFTALAIVLIVIAAAIAIWKLYVRPTPSVEVASKEKMAFPLPDLPSIAVLPFLNMSGDPKQDFFSDGITESIITALSKVPRLFVIARNSTFTYKGKPVKVKQVSEELGVRYVLEGSVQKSSDRVRITAQLINALTGHHLWAERYDRDLKDIFAVQDEITMKILTATQVKLTTGELSLGEGKHYRGRQGLDCYLKILEGSGYLERQSIEDNNMARRIAEEVMAMCPEVPMAYQLMAWVHLLDYWLGSTKSPREPTEKGIEMIQKALALDDKLAEAHALLSHFYIQKRDYDKAIAEGERAVALNPSGATAIAFYAVTLQYACRPEEAITLFQKAIRLNPFGPIFYHNNLGLTLANTGRYEEAVSALKKVVQRAPNHMLIHVWLAATYSMMGQEKEARTEAEEAFRINPKISLDSLAKILPYKDQSISDNYINALRKAGLK